MNGGEPNVSRTVNEPGEVFIIESNHHGSIIWEEESSARACLDALQVMRVAYHHATDYILTRPPYLIMSSDSLTTTYTQLHHDNRLCSMLIT